MKNNLQKPGTLSALIAISMLLTNTVGALTSPSAAIAAGTWSTQTGAGIQMLGGVALSSDGTKLVAVAQDEGYGNGLGGIFTSTDFGAHLTQQSITGLWTYVASSSDGTKLAAAQSPGYIFTSTNSGVTWTQQTNSDLRQWNSIASSADGTKLAAVASHAAIYTSTDSGATWTQKSSGLGASNTAVASNSDGTKLLAAQYGYTGFLYTTNDGGANWTKRIGAGIGKQWLKVASNSDGTKLVAAQATGNIYTSSDSGATWTKQTTAGSRGWVAVASSGDGTTIAAAAANSYIFLSHDSGATWAQQTGGGTAYWGNVALSSDGTKLAAVNSDGGISLFADAAAAAPSVASVSPNVGSIAGGTSITITGTGFAAGATVSVGGATCTNVTVVSATSITCSTPAGSAGSKDVVVTNTDAQTVTSTSAFTYTRPLLSASTPSIANTYTGSTSAVQTETITNTGDGDLVFGASAVTVSGTNAADYTIVADGCSGQTVAPSATCTVTYTFTPGGVGSRTGNLVFTSNETGSPNSVSLSATGVGLPIFSASTPSIPNTYVGATSADQTETITNTGNGDLVFGAGAVTVTGSNSSDFTIVADNCSGQTVAPSATCTVTYTFTPGGVGSRNANLVFASNEIGSPNSVSLSATGVGLPIFSASTPSIANTYTGSTSALQTETVTNTGDGDLIFGAGAVTVTGANRSDYTIVADNCSNQTVVPAGTCNVTYNFKSLVAGTRTANLVFASNAVSSPDTVALSAVAMGVVTIKKIESTSGSTRGGQSIEISGTGFNAAATVTFGGVNATVSKRSGSTKLVVRTPAHAAGKVAVVVTNPDTGNASYNGFTYKR